MTLRLASAKSRGKIVGRKRKRYDVIEHQVSHPRKEIKVEEWGMQHYLNEWKLDQPEANKREIRENHYPAQMGRTKKAIKANMEWDLNRKKVWESGKRTNERNQIKWRRRELKGENEEKKNFRLKGKRTSKCSLSLKAAIIFNLSPFSLK